MKRKIFCVLAAFILIISTLSITVAADNTFDIDIAVTIRENGDATVVQRWYGSFYEGTENYLPIGNFADGMDVTNFKAWDKIGEFEILDEWDIEADREDKARKCGVVETDVGYELCYGIGEYGENEYWFSYDIIGLVGAYDDKDGFNFQFVNREMNCYPTDVKLFIANEAYTGNENDLVFNDEICDIYAFGYDGRIEFVKNIGIMAYTETPLDSGNRYVNVVVGFEKGTLNPDRIGEEESFEELLKTAKEGSSYGDNSEDLTALFVILGIIAGICIIIVIVALSHTLYINSKIKRFVEETDYFRDTPCNDDMEIAYFVSKKYKQTKDESTIIGATILRLINTGCIEPIYETDIGFFGKEKNKVHLKMCYPPNNHGTPESSLYNVLFAAAGEDGVLQEKELKKYCEKHPEKLRDFINDASDDGEMKLERNGIVNSNIYKSSEFTQQQLREVVGLKKYLLDFSLISEREIKESVIWKDYLVYAALFDIADKVMEQFKEVYPEKLPEIEQYDNTVILVHSYSMLSYNAMRSGEAARSAGSGGRSSFGGGGGFSGGGVGGGSR